MRADRGRDGQKDRERGGKKARGIGSEREGRATDRSVRKEQMRCLALSEISVSSGKASELLWSMILPYVPTSESA